MASYFYGNIDGQYRSVGKHGAETLFSASTDTENVIFCRMGEQSICGKIQPQWSAVAASKCSQAGIYPGESDDFIWAEFYDEATLLDFVRQNTAPELNPIENHGKLTEQNAEIAKYLCCKITEVDQHGGVMPDIILDASDDDFLTQVRSLAEYIFARLPRKITERKGICTGKMAAIPRMSFTRLLPAKTQAVDAIHAANCKMAYDAIAPQIRDMVSFWLDAQDVVKKYGSITDSMKQWDNIRSLYHWERGEIADTDLPKMLELYRTRQGACWAMYIEQIVANADLQKKLAALEQQRLQTNAESFDNANSVVEYYQNGLSLFQGEIRRLVAVQVNNQFRQYCREHPSACIDLVQGYQEHKDTICTEVGAPEWSDTLKDMLEAIIQEGRSRVSMTPSVATLLEECRRLQNLGENVKPICSSIGKSLTETRAEPLTLLPEILHNEQELKETLDEETLESLFIFAEQQYIQAVMNLTSNEVGLFGVQIINEKYVLPYKRIWTGWQALAEKVFDRITQKYYGAVSFEDLVDNRDLILSYITEEKYNASLKKKINDWEEQQRKQISRQKNKVFKEPTQVNVMGIANEFRAMLEYDSAGGENATLANNIRNALNEVLDRLEPTHGDTPEYFDAWEGLCDLSKWKNKFSKRATRPKAGKSVSNTQHKSKKTGSKVKSQWRMKDKMLFGLFLATCILMILFFAYSIALNVRHSRQVAALTNAYEAWRNGDTTAENKIRDLSMDYKPAYVVLELITDSSYDSNSSQTRDPAQTTNPALPSYTTEASEDSVAAEVTEPVNPSTFGENDKENGTDAEARWLWKNGEYLRAMDAFDALSTVGVLDFDVTMAEPNDPELEYGALCSVLSIEEVEGKLNYSNVLMYVYQPNDQNQEDGFDFNKPIYCFTADEQEYLCAYQVAAERYVYWCSSVFDSALVTRVVDTGEMHDLLSMTRIRVIRDNMERQ